MGPTRRRWTFSRAWPTRCRRRPTAPHLMIVTAQAELAKRRPAPGGRQRAADAEDHGKLPRLDH
jgi:hypothetical protein